MRSTSARPGRRLPLPGLLVLLLAGGLTVVPRTASAQSGGGVYAITDARLVTVTGRPISGGTIVVRDGLIEAVGRGAAVPADAVVIDGSGLTVYPGFIDAYAQAGIAAARGQEREYAANIADRSATERFDPAADDLADRREQGFTTALIARNDGIFSGQAALVNLAGEDATGMTIKAPVVQVLTYQGQQGYPGTLMAVVAFQRQTLIDAAYQQMLHERFERDPSGMQRPPVDPALAALAPVAAGTAPILVEVHRENDLVRLQKLAGEFGLDVWIAGAEEAFRAPEVVRGFGTPVIVSLDFPAIQGVTGYQFDRAFHKLSDEERRELDERDRMAVEGNPGVVADLGVPFALSTTGMPVSRFHRNLMAAIEAGLDPDRALRALTIAPAALFGVERVLGSLEAGKIANLTVTTGDFFADGDAEVACVFIDGVLEAFTELQMTEGGDHDRR